MAGMRCLFPLWVGVVCVCAGSAQARAQTPTEAPPPPASTVPDKQGPGISIYSYEDEQGIIHFVDSLDLVPEAFRVQAAERAKAGAMVGDGQGGTVNVIAVPAFPETGSSSSQDIHVDGGAHPASVKSPAGGEGPGGEAAGSGGVDGEGGAPVLEGKAYWQARIAEWRDRKAAAQAEIKAVETQMLRTRTLTPAGFQKTMGELEQRRRDLEAEIRLADNMLNEVIPEEARKAGVPPGWLRSED